MQPPLPCPFSTQTEILATPGLPSSPTMPPLPGTSIFLLCFSTWCSAQMTSVLDVLPPSPSSLRVNFLLFLTLRRLCTYLPSGPASFCLLLVSPVHTPSPGVAHSKWLVLCVCVFGGTVGIYPHFHFKIKETRASDQSETKVYSLNHYDVFHLIIMLPLILLLILIVRITKHFHTVSLCLAMW